MIRRLAFVAAAWATWTAATIGQAPTDPSLERMKKNLFFLAGPECEGRGPGTKGLELAANHIAKQFADYGLKPGGADGYFQPFTISGTTVQSGKPSVTIVGPQGQRIALAGDRKDFETMGNSGSGKVSAGLVFVGYGISAKNHGLDEYAGVDVAGKIVVLMRRTPRWNNPDLVFAGKERDKIASLESKVASAESRKAAAVVLVNVAADLAKSDEIEKFSYLTTAISSRIPFVHMKRSAIEPAVQSALGMTLAEVERAIDRDLKPRSAALTGWSAEIETNVSRTEIAVKNVIGVLPGKGPRAKEYVVVGSHYDHLGYGGPGSLAKGSNAIHHGADDNASGTTAMLELAHRYSRLPDREGRTLLFMAFSAEERGLLGSRHYCEKPLFPLADTAAMVNLDMVGKLRPDGETKKDRVLVEGVGTAKDFGELLDRFNKGYDFHFVRQMSGFGPSDHGSFNGKKIPVLFFWTGTHPDYHRPTDTADRIHLDGMKKIVDFVDPIVEHLASSDRRQYVEVKGGPKKGPSGPRLGIGPSYDETKPGVGVDSVSDGMPASKAGIKAGDRIVEIAGRNVSNLETYMVIMADQRPGQPIPVTLIRDGNKLTLKVTLE